MSKLMVIDHPLVQHKLSHLRDKKTGSKEFRELVEEIAMLLTYEATRDLPLKETMVETPVAMAKTYTLAGRKLGIVPILRAGLGMVDGMLSLIPAAKVGHIGLYRDPETLNPVDYYCKLPPDVSERDIIIVDPMLATGGSAVEGINVASIIIFGIFKLVPGDPATMMLEGNKTSMKPEEYQAKYEQARAKLGLDQPIPVQYV